ncbi:MAG: Eco57I restriction-modification methylase domain-containing protein [Desulfovibrio sp.]|nr:Eco57I restriction-modification methylase domain-containing protein [Desulfovibrio sp.]
MEKLIDINSYPIINVLDLLLHDASTKKNIIWATDTYKEFGDNFTDKEQIHPDVLLQGNDVIRPRIQKQLASQAQRTRKKAEVFTPAWLCNRMNNYCDADWFGRADVFTTENEDHTWAVREGRIAFPMDKTWQQYVHSRRLEITCGEAPFLVSRYDVSTGERIVPPLRRIGMLDRKLRIVNENTETYDDWLQWAMLAFESCYGYEYQGDNVLIARSNLLLTFMEYYEERWDRRPDDKLLELIARKIVWNIWQMDGLKDTVPLGKSYEKQRQMTLFDMPGIEREKDDEQQAVPCRIFDWSKNIPLKFMDIKEKRGMEEKLFDYVIGNPPYQEDREGDSNTATPVYHNFMNETYKISTASMLITPARFLFNTGYTPKIWNQERLHDTYFKIVKYYTNSSDVFKNVEIKGGVVISYRDIRKKYGVIDIYTKYTTLNDIFHKVIEKNEFKSITDIMVTSFTYHFNKVLYDENPKLIGRASKGHSYDLQSNIFSIFPEIFYDSIPNDNKKYISILGREGNKRCCKYIRRDYVNSVINLDKYKLFISKAFGTGQFGEIMPDMILGKPSVGSTITFLSVGAFDTEFEAITCEKYLKSKFARTLLGVLKATQNASKPCYRMIPLQDFTSSSDIDWSKEIHDIDRQLYCKYGLLEKEIAFIETHVKEMI